MLFRKHTVWNTWDYGMTSGKSRRWYYWMQECWMITSELCEMAHGVEEHVFIVKIFYQTISFVTVQRQFWRKFSRWQAPAVFAIIDLVQKLVSATTKKVWLEGTGQQAYRTVLLVNAECCFRIQENLWHDVPSHSVSKEWQYTPSCDEMLCCILTKSKWYRCSLKPTSSRGVNSVGTS